jgi:hypothetical protein
MNGIESIFTLRFDEPEWLKPFVQNPDQGNSSMRRWSYSLQATQYNGHVSRNHLATKRALPIIAFQPLHNALLVENVHTRKRDENHLGSRV